MSDQANNPAAVVVEPTIVLVALSQAQARAMHMMGFDAAKRDAVAKATLGARIKGDFKRYREAEAKMIAQVYDNSSKRGAKWDISKDEFLKQSAKDSAAIMVEL
jgi:hypothetical protein